MSFAVRAVLGLVLLSTTALAAQEPATEPATEPHSEAPRQPVPASPALPVLPGDIPARRFTVDHLFVGAYNAVGVEYNSRLGYQVRQGHSEDLLFRDTYLNLGAQVRINPAYSTVGPRVEWQPLAILNLRALVDVMGFYGAFGMLQSFRSPGDAYPDALLGEREARGDIYSTAGWHARLEPTLQAQVGPIALQNTLSLDYWSLRLRGEDTVWYDSGQDTLLPGRGWTLTNETNLVWLGGPLTLGLNFRYLTPLYTQADVRPGEDLKAVDNTNMRLGLLAAYTFFDNGYSAFNKPSVFALVDWHLHHRYRTGQETPQLLPLIVLGFNFQQDFVL